MYHFKLLAVCVMCLGFMACQRVIDVDIAVADAQPLVIEGNLTDKTGAQTVSISRVVAYSSSNVYPTVSGARVTITDASGNIYKLPETAKAGTYGINSFKGKTANLYTLTIKLADQTYTAASVMPMAVNLDSLSLSYQVFGTTQVKTVSVNYRDPVNIPNQYRYVMYVNGVQVKRIFVENDNLTDGRVVSSTLYQREIELMKGDKVEVEMQCIDEGIYNYWTSLNNQSASTLVNASAPANPPSNFDNNALGYFSAHTSQRKLLIIP
ncbi:DUF4249 domain-containing protein [Mucilaginibacter paludis]|uniref:DUF4249 domain-containing protein n=1 Tax=Mucilaginibacter paludis DSM 18603 TaxID=714943 RepID=H1Y5J9_9SPHI|nr:DUF4249 domain-containing protein [Mucilaginibacter paludis]EHQ29351.1 hypothetical protein Mucpa_5276 [Mucilaginibacter paludis DSM 18603]